MANFVKLLISSVSFRIRLAVIHILSFSLSLSAFYNLIIMLANKNHDQTEQCFLSPQLEEVDPIPPEELVVNVSTHFYKQLPANELRTSRRPDNLAPRTFFLERPFFQLRAVLNEPCIQAITSTMAGKLKLKIANSQNLSLQQYFDKKKFRCVYNRLESYPKDSRSFQGRLKGIDLLVDYNQKFFKELEEQVKPSTVFMDKIDADFESGNLCRAYVSAEQEKEFYLLIENDLNTYGYNNWFFFRLTHRAKGIRRFTIVNFIKKTNFFNQGMMVSIFSLKKNRFEGCGWFKGGQRITFGSINLGRYHHVNDKYNFLSFQYDCQFQDDQVYFALNQPYTYSRLVNFIENAKKETKSISMSVKSAGYSISNNIIPSIKLAKQDKQNKDIILILGRQHPCETVGSFVAEGIIRYLLSSHPIVTFLFDRFDFIIIPMVNPDGVIHGSSRCNMAGFDLNRQWGEYIIKQLTPETVKIKQLICNLAKNQTIRYMLDLHGHGKKLNSFFFSCKDNDDADARLFSNVMCKLQPRFTLQGCTYGISKDKVNTIRSTINGMGIAHSYTLQTSLYGWKDQENEIKHFNQNDYNQIAKSLMNSIFLIEADPYLTLRELGLTRQGIENQMQKSVQKKSKEEEENYDDNDILSDSDPEGDKLDVKELLGKCEDKTLRKKIQQQLQKEHRQRRKKSTLQKPEGRKSLSSKNIRQTCTSALIIRPKAPIVSQSIGKRKEIKQSSSNKISLSQKWKERRKQIEKKKIEKQREFLEQNQRINFSRLQSRPRIKTEANISKPLKNLVHPSYIAKSHLAKTRHFAQKMKTQFREVEQMSLPSEQEIKETQNRKSALETKFKQLKQQSLNVLLTDTLSILKISPNQKHLSPEMRENKTVAAKVKKQHHEIESSYNESSKVLVSQEPMSNGERDSLRYRKFRQFLNGGSAKKKDHSVNSVFYYFPVL